MKHALAVCAGIVLMSPLYAHDSYLAHSLNHVAASPLFDEAEKELITKLPEFFTHACVKQLYFGDTEQRALKPFVEAPMAASDLFKPIKEKLVQLQEQTRNDEEKNIVSFVQYLVNVLVDQLPTDHSFTHPSATRAPAADVAEACRELILEVLDVVDEINTNVNTIIGNITAPCT